MSKSNVFLLSIAILKSKQNSDVMKQKQLGSKLISEIVPWIPEACNFIKKETSTQSFSCEVCKNFKYTFFTEHLRATTSAGVPVLRCFPLNLHI